MQVSGCAEGHSHDLGDHMRARLGIFIDPCREYFEIQGGQIKVFKPTTQLPPDLIVAHHRWSDEFQEKDLLVTKFPRALQDGEKVVFIPQR